ncbi:hypothetical protein [Parasedimentitalea maritima]|uniref:Uncharacterized protein n=1 Tax=Parasedimentitalea maritima TaxID=2578117 RepID=A0A6A4RCC7_9RHOB|nr:hypothetical protein [Zongyanglinia marina]KAE9627648.1 hypothetical protein GP644_18895 [Zongyanglinia marina]
MQFVLKVMNVLGLAALMLLFGAMQFGQPTLPAQVLAPPSIDTLVLERQG